VQQWYLVIHADVNGTSWVKSWLLISTLQIRSAKIYPNRSTTLLHKRMPRFIISGTFITVEGLRLSTKAKSNAFRTWGMSIIGMTASPDAFLRVKWKFSMLQTLSPHMLVVQAAIRNGPKPCLPNMIAIVNMLWQAHSSPSRPLLQWKQDKNLIYSSRNM
jgi:hypothetical protein